MRVHAPLRSDKRTALFPYLPYLCNNTVYRLHAGVVERQTAAVVKTRRAIPRAPECADSAHSTVNASPALAAILRREVDKVHGVASTPRFSQQAELDISPRTRLSRGQSCVLPRSLKL